MVTGRVLGVLGAVAIAATLSGQTRPVAEYRIKAVFLFNFVQFVQWPASAFANERAPLVICVLGRNPFGDALDQTVYGESVGNRRIVVRRTAAPENFDGCHLLFVSNSEKGRVAKVLEAVDSPAPVLTVSDIDGFVAGGGTIGFYVERNRVRFEIDPAQAQRHRLKLSSQLLGLGRIRDPGPGGGR